MSTLPRGMTVRRDAGLYGYERALRRAGMTYVAGVDEAGRGACAGPLVAAAAILPEGKAGQVPGLADSKLLTAKARERCYEQVLRRALAWSVVVVGPEECDRLGMHVANVEALRRSLARLEVRPSYVLTDGFPVDGLEVPGLAVWKGDRVAACISAASVVAKVTRDRIMVALDRDHPAYDFKTHKGYVTDVHNAALLEHGPCPEHRMRFVNVRRAAGLEPLAPSVDGDPSSVDPDSSSVDPDASSVELVETTSDPPTLADREPSLADLVEATSVGHGTSQCDQVGERGETA
jgi:ribonuclease HII